MHQNPQTWTAKTISFFLNFFIFLSYLIMPKNTSETHILQFFHKNSSQACEWTLNISFRAFLKKFPFFEFLYLFITPNSAKKYTRNTNFSIFPLGACSKIPKPKQCTPGKTLPSWCQHRNLFAPKHKILMAGLKVC